MPESRVHKIDEHLSKMVGVVATVNSAILLALSTKIIDMPLFAFPDPILIFAVIIAVVALPFLLGYLFIAPAEKIDTQTHSSKAISNIGFLGLIIGCIPYLLLIYSLHKFLLLIFAVSTIVMFSIMKFGYKKT